MKLNKIAMVIALAGCLLATTDTASAAFTSKIKVEAEGVADIGGGKLEKFSINTKDLMNWFEELADFSGQTLPANWSLDVDGDGYWFIVDEDGDFWSYAAFINWIGGDNYLYAEEAKGTKVTQHFAVNHVAEIWDTTFDRATGEDLTGDDWMWLSVAEVVDFVHKVKGSRIIDSTWSKATINGEGSIGGDVIIITSGGVSIDNTWKN